MVLRFIEATKSTEVDRRGCGCDDDFYKLAIFDINKIFRTL